MINLLNSGLKRNNIISKHDFEYWSHAFLTLLVTYGMWMMTVKGDNNHERRERDGGYCK